MRIQATLPTTPALKRGLISLLLGTLLALAALPGVYRVSTAIVRPLFPGGHGYPGRADFEWLGAGAAVGRAEPLRMLSEG